MVEKETLFLKPLIILWSIHVVTCISPGVVKGVFGVKCPAGVERESRESVGDDTGSA